MSLNPPPAIVSNKATPSQPTLSSPLSQAGGNNLGETVSYRRNGGSGSFGAGANTRAVGAPRNGQTGKKQHKASKKFRLSDDDAFAEASAMRSLNSRKGQTSITHLMNFSLPPRPQLNNQHGRYSRRNPTWGLGSGYHAADKARYVHANYRFIVDPRPDYSVQAMDADVHLDWSNVLQILASAVSQDASCPICLGHPVAPRMAKCGHIFCLPCLIRYMQSEEQESRPPEKRARWKKCPICEDSIYMSETRPARWYTGQEQEQPREGADIILRLVKRDFGSPLALPRDGADAPAKGEEIPWHIAAEVMDYARIMKGSEAYMLEQFDRDIQDLKQQEKEDELMFGEDNAEWVQKSVKMIHEAKDKVRGIGEPPTIPEKPMDQKLRRPPLHSTEGDKYELSMHDMQCDATSGQKFTTKNIDSGPVDVPDPAVSSMIHRQLFGATSLPESIVSARTINGRQIHHSAPPSEYYFYQALPHHYLSPLDIRILKTAFGPYSSFPSTLLPRLERITYTVVDDDLRKKTKYLSHLPFGCEVSFLECDWTDTVPENILAQFASEISKRRKRREDKDAREEKARVRAEKLEEEMRFGPGGRRGKGRVGGYEVDGAFSGSADDFQPLNISASPPADVSGAEATPPGGWSGARPGFGALASPSSSPNTRRTVWGTAAVTPSSPPLIAHLEPKGPVDDGWLQGWEKDLLGEDEMIKEAQALSLGEGSKSNVGGGKKKGKKKKVVLMSTGSRGPRV